MRIDDKANKYAVLGDMLEIGSYTEEGHRLVGKAVVENKISQLIAVGERARDFIRGAKEAGMEDDYIFILINLKRRADFYKTGLRPGIFF